MKKGEKKILPKWKTQICPLMPEQHCLGPECALWVALEKTGGNPIYEMVFEGCGLISNIPWAVREHAQEDSK